MFFLLNHPKDGRNVPILLENGDRRGTPVRCELQRDAVEHYSGSEPRCTPKDWKDRAHRPEGLDASLVASGASCG